MERPPSAVAPPHAAEETAPRDAALARARELVLRHGWSATSYQILNPGIERWFPADGTEAVVGYVPGGSYRVVAGAPVCAAADLLAVVAAFERDSRRAGRGVCYFGAESRLAGALAVRAPGDRALLGAQPAWDPAAWPQIVAGKASLRAQLHRARNKGVTAGPWPAAAATADPRLRRCLAEWLRSRGLPPLHFLVEPQTLERLFDRRVFVATRGGEVVAFLVASPVPARRGWLIEQIVRGRGAVNGTSELLLDAAFRALAHDRAAYVTLGLAPLSRRMAVGDVAAAARPSPAVRLALAWVREHGRRFYDFEGLDAFKAKLQPQRWEPLWAITAEGRFGLRELYAITGAFARSSPPLFLARGLLRALAREVAGVGAGERGGRRGRGPRPRGGGQPEAASPPGVRPA